MAEVNVTSALEAIESGEQKKRSQGLEDLRSVLRHNQRKLKEDLLKDSSFRSIYEVLFRTVSLERSIHLKSLTSTSKSVKSASVTRLSACAYTLRTAVEVGVQSINLKTVRLLIDHITDAYLDSTGKSCEPLALDYAKSLRSLLTYAPHAERLRTAEWTDLYMFCLARVKDCLSDNIEDASAGASSGGSRRSGKEMSLRTSRSTNGDSQGNRISGTSHSQMMTEFFGCLRYLSSAPSVPVINVAPETLRTVLQYFEAKTTAASPDVDALIVANQILERARTEMTNILIELLPRFLGVVKVLWHQKSTMIKNEALITLTVMEPFVGAAFKRVGIETLKARVDSVIEVLINDYSTREEKDQLVLKDLYLDYPQPTLGLGNQIFCLRDNNLSAEAQWSILTLISSFSSASDNTSFEASPSDDESTRLHPRKRLRQAAWIDEMLRMAKDPSKNTRICGLQLLALRLHGSLVEEAMTLQICDVFTVCYSTSNGSVASWTLLALAW